MVDLDRVAALHPTTRLTMRTQTADTDLTHERRIRPSVTEPDDLIEQRRRPQVRIVNEPGPDIRLERRQRIGRRRHPPSRHTFAIQIRADRLRVSFQMAGDRRDRPAPFPQCVHFHVFSLCEHWRRDSFGPAAWSPSASKGSPSRWWTYQWSTQPLRGREFR